MGDVCGACLLPLTTVTATTADLQAPAVERLRETDSRVIRKKDGEHEEEEAAEEQEDAVMTCWLHRRGASAGKQLALTWGGPVRGAGWLCVHC